MALKKAAKIIDEQHWICESGQIKNQAGSLVLRFDRGADRPLREQLAPYEIDALVMALSYFPELFRASRKLLNCLDLGLPSERTKMAIKQLRHVVKGCQSHDKI